MKNEVDAPNAKYETKVEVMESFGPATDEKVDKVGYLENSISRASTFCFFCFSISYRVQSMCKEVHKLVKRGLKAYYTLTLREDRNVSPKNYIIHIIRGGAKNA